MNENAFELLEDSIRNAIIELTQPVRKDYTVIGHDAFVKMVNAAIQSREDRELLGLDREIEVGYGE